MTQKNRDCAGHREKISARYTNLYTYSDGTAAGRLDMHARFNDWTKKKSFFYFGHFFFLFFFSCSFGLIFFCISYRHISPLFHVYRPVTSATVFSCCWRRAKKRNIKMMLGISNLTSTSPAAAVAGQINARRRLASDADVQISFSLFYVVHLKLYIRLSPIVRLKLSRQKIKIKKSLVVNWINIKVCGLASRRVSSQKEKKGKKNNKRFLCFVRLYTLSSWCVVLVRHTHFDLVIYFIRVAWTALSVDPNRFHREVELLAAGLVRTHTLLSPEIFS